MNILLVNPVTSKKQKSTKSLILILSKKENDEKT